MLKDFIELLEQDAARAVGARHPTLLARPVERLIERRRGRGQTAGARSGCDGGSRPRRRTRSAHVVRLGTRVLALAGFVWLAWYGVAEATVECRPLIAEYVNWIKARQGNQPGDHRVGAKLAAVKIREKQPDRYPWGHGSYADGGFGLHGNDLMGRFLVAFSDRKRPGADGFDPAQRDIQDVTVFADGRVQVMLRSWGDATLWLEDVRCYGSGFITGIKREGNGVSMVSLLLRKEVIIGSR